MNKSEQESFLAGYTAYAGHAREVENPCKPKSKEFNAWHNGWLRAYTEDFWRVDNFTHAYL